MSTRCFKHKHKHKHKHRPPSFFTYRREMEWKLRRLSILRYVCAHLYVNLQVRRCMKMYEDLRQDSAPHHILTSLLAVWKCDKAWFLLWATIANHTTSTRTFLDNLNQKLRPPLAPILLIGKMVRFGFRACSSVIRGEGWFIFYPRLSVVTYRFLTIFIL